MSFLGDNKIMCFKIFKDVTINGKKKNYHFILNVH